MICKGNIVSAPPVPAPAATEEVKPAKARGKKFLIILVLILVLIGGAVAGWLVLSRRNAPLDEGDGADAAHAAAKTPPTFLPLENMVVNLADPGGERMAQIGITIELADAKASEKVKAYLPSIRSAILLLISQRTSAELLQREGKEKLAHDILREVSKPLGFTVGPLAQPAAPHASATAAKKAKGAENAEPNPVQGVLFSSFIVQ